MQGSRSSPESFVAYPVQTFCGSESFKFETVDEVRCLSYTLHAQPAYIVKIPIGTLFGT